MKKNGGVLLICEETGNFLLGERAKNILFQDCWSLFGGSIEEGESILEGVKRELKEETKISSDNIKYDLLDRKSVV